MISKEFAYKAISELVDRFSDQYESYKKSDYNETLTRRDFIDPFFKALGWDIDNSEGYAESYREVIHEDKIKVGGATKAPDYSFRLVGGKRLFFVEAKKPSVSVKNEILPAYQVRRYGWSAKLSISIITDFEEFAIYDCTKKPNPADKTSTARIKYLNFKDYLNEFDFIWDTFSKERVLKGSFDKFIQSDTYKKGTATVDKEFLQSLDNWRSYLAISIAINNKALDEDEINFAVQQVIDRIIFLRIAEDRGVEPYGNLKDAITDGHYYKHLFEQFRRADEKYNSGLFDFKKDKISEHLKIDDKVVKTIVSELYYPESPYEFSVLSVEILGSAYEQFLGKVIRITPGHHAKIEEKPEVRKAGGVYYTPQYIVEYIVHNTVGNILKKKTPKDVSNIKIVDPACGSGSFLIGAYQYLLDWHKDYYCKSGKPSKGKKNNPLTPDGNLTTAEKKRILLNNIFGVDIDVNAVEVTKLSLLLKCMEGETSASINYQLSMFHERVLPTLDNNIKDGNSLIDTDYYSSELDLGYEKLIKPFNWQNTFPDVFKQGGFDIVIGNPPYRTLQLGKKQESQEIDILSYYQNHYSAAFEYKINLFALFIEKSVSLIKNEGYFSFIVPNALYNTISFKPIRKYLLASGSFEIIMDLRYKVFEDAEIGGSGIFVFSKGNKAKESEILSIADLEEFAIAKAQIVTKEDFMNDPDYNLIQSNGGNTLLQSIKKQKGIVELGSIIKIYQGIITGDNKKYLSAKQVNSKWQPILKGRDINRYTISFNNTYVYYSPKDLWSNTNEKMFKVKEKIISRQTSDRLVAALDTDGYFSLDSTHVIHLLNHDIDIKYLLGLFNSKLLNYIYQNKVQERGRVFAQVKTVNLKPLPIKLIDIKNNEEAVSHDEIVKYVDELLKLNEQMMETKLQTKINQQQSKIDYCESRINEIVYQLYGLTEAEIGIVEDKN